MSVTPVFARDTWLLSRGLLLEVDRDACEGRRLLTTWTSRSVSTDESKTQARAPSLLLLSTCSGGGDGNSSTMRQSQLHILSVAPEGSCFVRGVREVLCCIQPAFHTSHGGLLVQSHLYATRDWGEEIQLSHRPMRCGRGDWVWGEEIWVSEEEFRVGKACDSFIDDTTARC